MPNRPEPWQWVEERDGYRLTVDVSELAGVPIVSAVKVERVGAPPFPGGTDHSDAEPISPRDVRRLPLSTVFERAKAAAGVMYEASRDPRAGIEGIPGQEINDAIRERLRRVSVPRGRPVGGRSQGFYAEILATHRELLAAGVEHPNAEIAKRKRVPRNTVDQWLYRARDIERRKRG